MLGTKIVYLTGINKSQVLPHRISSVKNQKVIFLTCRSLPSQSYTNHFLKGFMDELSKKEDLTKEANFLRERYLVVIVPMINPDGVMIGNSRCSLSGQDLQKKWEDPDRLIHPEIYYTKKLLYNLNKQNEIVFFAEIAGDNKKSSNWLRTLKNNADDNSEDVRIFPALWYEFSHNFEYKNCE